MIWRLLVIVVFSGVYTNVLRFLFFFLQLSTLVRNRPSVMAALVPLALRSYATLVFISGSRP